MQNFVVVPTNSVFIILRVVVWGLHSVGVVVGWRLAALVPAAVEAAIVR
jgi:hypothetical protein